MRTVLNTADAYDGPVVGPERSEFVVGDPLPVTVGALVGVFCELFATISTLVQFSAVAVTHPVKYTHFGTPSIGHLGVSHITVSATKPSSVDNGSPVEQHALSVQYRLCVFIGFCRPKRGEYGCMAPPNTRHGQSLHTRSHDGSAVRNDRSERESRTVRSVWKSVRPIVATETIYTLIAQPSCDQVCIDFQLLL